MRILSIVFVLFAVGCGTSIVATPINSPPHAMQARSPDTVEVFTSGAPVRPHVDVAILQVSYSDEYASDILASLRSTAAGLGCDAVVIDGGNATCIAYSDLPADVASADYNACVARVARAQSDALKDPDIQERGARLTAIPHCGPK